MQATTGMFAGPMSYELDSQQYVAVSTGSGQASGNDATNRSRLLVFALNGTRSCRRDAELEWVDDTH